MSQVARCFKMILSFEKATYHLEQSGNKVQQSSFFFFWSPTMEHAYNMVHLYAKGTMHVGRNMSSCLKIPPQGKRPVSCVAPEVSESIDNPLRGAYSGRRCGWDENRRGKKFWRKGGGGEGQSPIRRYNGRSLDRVRQQRTSSSLSRCALPFK